MKYLIIFILFYLSVNVNAQPCGALYRGMDRQIVMPDNHLILINTYFSGDLMDMYDDDKEITIEYAIFSPEGKLLTDSSIYLKWKDMHYNYMDCICTYNPQYKIDEIYNEVNSSKGTCPIYFPYFKENELVLSYFLRGDRRNIYEISIKNNGENDWHIYNIDTLSAEQGIPNASAIKTEMNKSLFFKSFLDDKYSNLKAPSHTKLVYDSISEIYSVKDCDVHFTPLSKEPFTKYKVTGKKWEIILNGSIIGFQYLDKPANQPLIDLKDNILFVTVFNDDYESCPGYGKDIYPVVYAIDVKKGKILWEKMLY